MHDQPPMESLSSYELFRLTQEENPEMAEGEFFRLKFLEAMVDKFHSAVTQALDDDELVHRTITPIVTGNMTKGDYAAAFGSLYGRVRVLRQYLTTLIHTIEHVTPDLCDAHVGAAPAFVITFDNPNDHPSGEWRQP